MKRASPLLQMTLALVGVCGTLVLLADLFFGVLPDRDAQALQLRKRITVSLRSLLPPTLPGDEARAGRRLATRESALAVAPLERRTPPG